MKGRVSFNAPAFFYASFTMRARTSYSIQHLRHA